MSATIPRRHDLDALRAIAMLLGIALHAAIAYIPMPPGLWAVQDPQQSEGFAVFMAAIHGFRMPLFFLVSGFFTAMLWRKRGLASVLVHRTKRIFLPLVIGMFTIVPAVWIVSIGVGIAGSQSVDQSAESNFWNAARLGDIEQMSAHVSAGADVNALDPVWGMTPLSITALHGQADAAKWLIERGADVDARDRDGGTPLHAAAIFGREKTAKLLLKNNARADMHSAGGDTVDQLLTIDWMTTQIVASIMQVEIYPDAVISGRHEIALALPEGVEVVASRVTSDDGSQNPALAGLIVLLTFFPVFHHLWFLWFLCLLVAAFAIYAAVLQVTGLKLPRVVVASPWCFLWLIPLTMVPQSMMGVLFPNFGPDTSVGLLPIPAVLGYYAIFFFFGAMYFDSKDDAGRLGRLWPITLPIALLLVFPVGYELTVGGLGFGGRILDYQYHRPASVVLQVIYTWLMTFGLMGLFRSVLSGESRTMRYISDSSYWLYLVHLPLIIVAQELVRDWQVPALVKWSLICTVSSLLLLASYHLFVRYTPIGTLLNGPRHRQSRPPQSDVECFLPPSGPGT